MNRKELVNSVAEKTGLSKKDTRKTLETIIDVISAEMQSDKHVILLGFGTFSVRKKAKRRGVNPYTMETIELPEKQYVRFNPSIYLNNMLTKKRKKRCKASE